MAGGSKAAVYAAIGGNSLVMIAKFIGFFLTGSGAMLSEGIHSLADVGNQALLALGMRRSAMAPDPTHPEGYSREAFVWALISAVGIFFLGCGFTVMHGIEALARGHGEVAGASYAIWILLFSAAVESVSLGIAVRGLMTEARLLGKGFWQHVRETDDPFGVAVLLEDSAAVLGVFLALGAILLTEYTHDARWDGLGSILIGVLLGFVAMFLIAKTRDLLVGRAISDADLARLHETLAQDPAVDEIAEEVAVVTGTNTYRVTAELDLDGAYLANKYLESHDLLSMHARCDTPENFKTFLEDYSEEVMELVGDEIDRIEERIRQEIPQARHIAVEID